LAGEAELTTKATADLRRDAEGRAFRTWNANAFDVFAVVKSEEVTLGAIGRSEGIDNLHLVLL
jgi:hypothetical protein